MLNHATQYSLIALLHLARIEPELRSVPTIAAAEQIPRKFLQSIMTDLKKAGLVISTPGQSGGYRLGRPAAAISIADVLQAMVSSQREQTMARSTTVARDNTDTGDAYQVAAVAIARAYDGFYADLGATTLRDLITPNVAER